MKNKNFGRKRQAIYISSNRKSTRIIKTLMDFFFFIKVKIKMICFSVPSIEGQGQSINKELWRYFHYSSQVPKASAFVQQRSKILDGTFEFLFKEFNDCFPSTHRFRGYDILATDGSDFDIPLNPSDRSWYPYYELP